MDINQLKSLITSTDDKSKQAEYCNCLQDYLSNNKATVEVISIIIAGVDIDECATLEAFIKSAKKPIIQTISKSIKECSLANNNINNNGIKFISILLSFSLCKTNKLYALVDASLTSLYRYYKDIGEDLSKEQKEVVHNYLVNKISSINGFVEWKDLKSDGEIIDYFATILLEILKQKEECVANKTLIHWLHMGKDYAKKDLEIKRIEAELPESKISILKDLYEHYEKVESKLKTALYDIDGYRKTVEVKQKEIDELEHKNSDQEEKIKELNRTIESLSRDMENAQKEIKDRKDLNMVQSKYREDSQASLLQDIATSLRAEYSDYAETKDEPMDVELGEIYRGKLKNIFKILEKKGIKVE